MNRTELAATTTTALQAYREQLQAQIEALDNELTIVDEALALWQQSSRNGSPPQLTDGTPESRVPSPKTQDPRPAPRAKPLRRAPWGQSARTVQNWFAQHPMAQMSISQLAGATNLSQQSVSKVIHDHTETYEQVEGRKWRLKAGAKLSA